MPANKEKKSAKSRRPRKYADWGEIEREWRNGSTVRELSTKYGLSEASIRMQKGRRNWELRKDAALIVNNPVQPIIQEKSAIPIPVAQAVLAGTDYKETREVEFKNETFSIAKLLQARIREAAQREDVAINELKTLSNALNEITKAAIPPKDTGDKSLNVMMAMMAATSNSELGND